MNIAEYIFRQTQISLTLEMQKQLDVYCDFLLAENEKYNLTAIIDKDAVWEKHFADSILGSCEIPCGASLCDIGSGAGFPALPLKIVRPDISVTLVDSLEKRIHFTQMLTEKLGISATFFHSRAEDFAKDHSEQFDIATARALAPLPILLEYAAQIVKIGGTVLAYKTDSSELPSAENACKVLGLQYQKHTDFVLPDGSKRSLLCFSKIAHTPSKYPRRQNKPRKFPL